MRPSIAAGTGVMVIALLLGAIVAEGAGPVVSRPPQEARSRPVTLPSNSPMTPADPLAAPTFRDAGAREGEEAAPALGARQWGDPTFDRPAIVLTDEPLPAAEPNATPRSTPRPSPRPAVTAWHADPEASWYGPGFYGKRTACGLAMTKTLIGVAHRTLPCGTLIVFRYEGRTVTAPVVDRGPYVPGRIWDLTAGLAIALDHLFTGPIEWRYR